MTVATFRIGLDEGMSIGELSRIYGFSRQRAARYAAEARAGRKVGDATRRLKRMDGPARSTAGKGSAVAAGRE
jgi:hypothetical protein